jgi:hypothetical protein
MQGENFAQIMQDEIDEARIAANPIASRANEVVRGVPFVGSFADEAVGLVSPQARDNMRASTEAMRRQRPGQTAAANIGGAIAGSIPIALAAAPSIIANAGVNLGTRALQAAGLGGITGATEGAIYGSGEGTTRQERADNALRGAGIGALAGTTVGAAAPYAAEGLKTVLGRLSRSDVATIATTLGVSREAATVVRNALDTGGVDDAVDALSRAGDGAMLADAGRTTRQLLDATAASGGRAGEIARTAVDERTRDATAQITRALDDTLGVPQGERELIDAVRTGSQLARSQAYNAAYAAPIDYSSGAGRALERLTPRLPGAAVSAANELMRTNGERSAQIMARIADDGSVTFVRMPDVRQWHYIMQGLDDVARRQDGQGGLRGQTPIGRSYANLRTQISTNLKSAVPEFRVAQDISADAIRQQDAIELGYTLLRSTTRREEVARSLSGAPRSERDAAAQGVRAYIEDTMGSVVRTMTDPDTTTREGIRVLRDLSSRNNRTKLRILLGQDRADALLGEVDQAATAFELRAAIAENSKTAVRQSIQAGVQEQTAPGIVTTLASGEPVNASKRLVQAMTGATQEAVELRQMGIYEEIAQALTGIRGARAEQAVRIMDRAIRGQAEITEEQAKIIADALVSASLIADRATSQALQ